jgi:Flp pilus assembly protein TadD
MTEQDQKLVEELNGVDFKELERQGTELFVPVELIVALAKGRLTHREAFGVTAESLQDVTRYAYRLVEHGHHEAAAMLFDTLVTLDPNIAYFHLGLGTALAGLGEKQAAGEAFEVARKLDPQELTAHHNLAALLLEEGDPEAARAVLEEARSIDPGGHHPMASMLRRLWIAHFEPA